jgi:hypothetical protein
MLLFVASLDRTRLGVKVHQEDELDPRRFSMRRHAGSHVVYLVKLSCSIFKEEDPFMKATSSELLMRNFNEIVELDPLKIAQ